MKKLGFEEDQLEVLLESIQLPQGMIPYNRSYRKR